MYHGSTALFKQFDLSHVLEGDGKAKFGCGVYLTSSYCSAAHYSAVSTLEGQHYVYTVEIPDLRADNYIKFKEPVCNNILKRAEERLGHPVPASVTKDGKDFRKYLAKTLQGSIDIEGEKAAAMFLDSVGVDYILWPYSWKNPKVGMNCAVFNAKNVTIVKVEQVAVDSKKQLIEGSQVSLTI